MVAAVQLTQSVEYLAKASDPVPPSTQWTPAELSEMTLAGAVAVVTFEFVRSGAEVTYPALRGLMVP